MTHRQAHTIYAATSLVATGLLSFLGVSLLVGRLGGTLNVLIFLLAAVTWVGGFALRYIVTN